MPRETRTTKTAKKAPRRTADDWVMAALGVLARGSIADVKVERLAADLGVTKGSFYWHFADRPALLAAMLERWAQLDTEQIIELVDDRSDPAEPVEALRTLMRVVIGSSSDFDGVETAIREWSLADPEAAALCATIDGRRVDYVTQLLVAAGVAPAEAAARAGVLYRIVIGEYTWRRYGGDPVDVDALLAVIDRLAAPS